MENFDKLQMLTPNPRGSCCRFHHTVVEICNVFLTWTRRRAQTRTPRLLPLRMPPTIASTGTQSSSSKAPGSFCFSPCRSIIRRNDHRLATITTESTSFLTASALLCNAPTHKLPIRPLTLTEPLCMTRDNLSCYICRACATSLVTRLISFHP